MGAPSSSRLGEPLVRKLPLKKTGGDVTHAVVKVAASAVPLVGNPLAELVGLIQTPLEKRRNEWLQDLADGVARLEEQGQLARESLSENEAFIDAVARGVQAAVRTGQADKRTALRNATLNSALDQLPDDAERQMFLDLVDRFTAWHLRILKAFQHPRLWAETHNVRYQPTVTSNGEDFIKAAFPELANREAFFRRAWTDLSQTGLVGGNIDAVASAHAWEDPRTTEIGNRFLAFIEEPHGSG